MPRGRRLTAATNEPCHSSNQRLRRDEPITSWVAFSARANLTSASAVDWPTTSWTVPPSSRSELALIVERGRLGAVADQAVAGHDVDADQVTADAAGHPRRPADQPVAAGRAGDADDDPLAGLPHLGDAVALEVVGERVLDPVGDPEQRQLAQRAEVARPEVVAQRGVDPLGGVDVAVRHAPAERLGRHVDELDLVGPPHDRVRHGLALGDAGDPGDDVVERLEVLDVQRRDDVDAGVEQLLDVLPALLVARARARWCGRTRRRARPSAGARGSRRGPSPRSPCRGTRRAGAGHLEVTELLLGEDPAVGLDEADHDVGAAVGRRYALVEHRVGLADARSGAEVDAERARAPCAQSRLVQRSPSRPPVISSRARLSEQHVDGRFAEHAEGPAGGVLVDHVVDDVERRGRGPSATRAPAGGRWRPRCAGRARSPTR